MKFYIATKLTRAAEHNDLRDVLLSQGHEITYDWTQLSSSGRLCTMKKTLTATGLAEVASKEMAGVLAADVVIVLMPGGRGTHVELGLALGANKKVILVTDLDDGMFATDERTCAFYHLKNVYVVAEGAEAVLALMKKIQTASDKAERTPPRAAVPLEPWYSGPRSEDFWSRINAMEDQDVYRDGCVLQNAEAAILKRLQTDPNVPRNYEWPGGLAAELATYFDNSAVLLQHIGQFVLIHSATIDDIFDTYADAITSGYKKFGMSTPFMVRQIQMTNYGTLT